MQRLSIKYRATIGYVVVAVAAAQDLPVLEKSGLAENHTQKQKYKNLLPNRGGCDKIYIIKQNKNFV